MRKRPIRFWVRHPMVDVLLGALVAAAYLAWRLSGQGALSVLDADDRGTVYSTIVGLAGGLVGFVLTPIAIVLALSPGKRLAALLKHHSEELRIALVGAFAILLCLLASSLIALAIDTGESAARAIRYAVLAFTVASLAALGRIIWHFNLMLKLLNADRSDKVVPLRAPPITDEVEEGNSRGAL